MMLKIGEFASLYKLLPLAAAIILSGCASALSKPEMAETAEPAAAPEPVMEEVVLESRALFAFDSAELTSEGMANLDSLVDEAAAGRVTVTGHTDRIGPEDYNMMLSERRANSVADYMAQKGVPSSSITASGRGEAEPVVECEDQPWNALVACLEPNRRVVVEYPVMREE